MAARSYGQHCAVAKSLDVVGDRWTLLVVRELLDGPRRYGDLLSALAPIATDVLAGRLRDLEAAGLVAKRALPRPSSGATYELTDEGRALEDVIHAYARWGRRLIERRSPGDVVRPEWLARAVRAHLRADRHGPAVSLRLATPDGSAAVVITADRIETLADDEDADVTLSGPAEIVAAALDPDQVADLLAAGRLRIDGDPEAVHRLGELFAPVPVRG